MTQGNDCSLYLKPQPWYTGLSSPDLPCDEAFCLLVWLGDASVYFRPAASVSFILRGTLQRVSDDLDSLFLSWPTSDHLVNVLFG